MYLDNKICFNEASNILNSSISVSKKDQLIFDSILKFSLSRYLSLAVKYELFRDLPLEDFTNRIKLEGNDMFMVDLFFSFLYTYQNLEGLSFDNRVPSKILEKYLLIYLGVLRYFKDNSIDIEDQTLYTMDFYLCSTDYFEHSNTRKYYLTKKESLINDFLFMLKRLGLIEGRIGSYYFISNISRYVALNYFDDTRKFSFPSLSPKKGLYINYKNVNFLESLNNNEKFNVGSFSAFDSYYSEYLVFCNGNDMSLKYRTFSEYAKNNENLNHAVDFPKYQKSLLLLYSYMDFICIRDLYKNRSIYYSYNKD